MASSDGGTLFEKARGLWSLLSRKPAVAPTPHDVVYRHGSLSLLRYEPRADAPTRRRTPVLIVPSLINRHYILDLMADCSLVDYLLGCGYEVLMVDWGHPRPEDRFTPLDDYTDTLLHRCVRRAARYGDDVGRVTLVGYCMGGTLAAIYAALHPERVRNLVTFAAPIDFSEAGLLGLWASRDHLDVDRLVDSLGNVPWPLMQASFHLMVPTLTAKKALHLYDRLEDAAYRRRFAALERWGADNVDFPGECYRRYIKDLYQGNRLMDGSLMIHGRPARLSAIRCAVLDVCAEHDHIVPLPCAEPLVGLSSSTDAELWTQPGGHIGAIVGRSASRKLWPRLDAWLAARSA